MGGDLQTLIRISLPIFLFLFCESLTTFGEYVILSYQGTKVLFSLLNGSYLSWVFQIPCTAIASMAQVFVGFYQGKGELKRIGPCVWQLIWFSILSLIITLPLSFWISSFYFKETLIEGIASKYFNVLAFGNFLFPLNTALTSFYLGRGKAKLVSLTLLTSYACNLGLCWILTSGIGDLIPCLGIQGVAVAKCFSLGVSCAIFFYYFLKKENQEIFGTGIWKLSFIELCSYILPGIMRAFGYLASKVTWAIISFLIIKKGGMYLEVQVVGGIVIAFLVFIPRGIYRSILTIAPNLLGSKNYAEIWKLCRSLMAYSCLIAIILIIPCIVYPKFFIYFFDTTSKEMFVKTFGMINYWIWLWILTNSIYAGLCGFMVALRDLKVQFYCYLLTILTSLFPVYIAFQLLQCKSDKLWKIMVLENVIFALIFLYRFYQKKWEKLSIHTKLIQNKPI